MGTQNTDVDYDWIPKETLERDLSKHSLSCRWLYQRLWNIMRSKFLWNENVYQMDGYFGQRGGNLVSRWPKWLLFLIPYPYPTWMYLLKDYLSPIFRRKIVFLKNTVKCKVTKDCEVMCVQDQIISPDCLALESNLICMQSLKNRS